MNCLEKLALYKESKVDPNDFLKPEFQKGIGRLGKIKPVKKDNFSVKRVGTGVLVGMPLIGAAAAAGS